MASIVREVVVEGGAAGCWDAVRDFASLHERLAPGFITDVQMVSPREREITFFSGAVAREYLVGIDDDRADDWPTPSSRARWEARITTPL